MVVTGFVVVLVVVAGKVAVVFWAVVGEEEVVVLVVGEVVVVVWAVVGEGVVEVLVVEEEVVVVVGKGVVVEVAVERLVADVVLPITKRSLRKKNK